MNTIIEIAPIFATDRASARRFEILGRQYVSKVDGEGIQHRSHVELFTRQGHAATMVDHILDDSGRRELAFRIVTPDGEICATADVETNEA